MRSLMRQRCAIYLSDSLSCHTGQAERIIPRRIIRIQATVRNIRPQLTHPLARWSQFEVMLLGRDAHRTLVTWSPAHVCLPFSTVSSSAPPTITVGCSRSFGLACPLLFPFVPTLDSIGLDSMNGLVSVSCTRCVESFLIDVQVLGSYFMSSSGYVSFLFYAFSCASFLYASS
jgi:hypothetical protein